MVDLCRNLEARYYVDERFFEQEREFLFNHAWQYLGPVSSVSKPGQYICRSVAGRGVVVLCGQDGARRGFINACRHRGAPLLGEGRGRYGRLLRCPYHMWVYDDHGQLVEAPWFGDNDAFTLKDWSLNAVQLDEWRGLLFAAFDPVESLTDQLGESVDELSDVPIEEFQLGGSAKLEFDANWKIYVDNFVEGYHIPGIHPNFYAQIDFEQFETKTREGIVCMRAPTSDDLFYLGRWYWMWPNWTLSLYPNGMSTSRINPTSASHTELHYNFHFANGQSNAADERKAVIKKNLSVIREDFDICLGLHKNYQTAGYEPGPLSPLHEMGVFEFQKRWHETVIKQSVGPRARALRQLQIRQNEAKP